MESRYRCRAMLRCSDVIGRQIPTGAGDSPESVAREPIPAGVTFVRLCFTRAYEQRDVRRHFCCARVCWRCFLSGLDCAGGLQQWSLQVIVQPTDAQSALRRSDWSDRNRG